MSRNSRYIIVKPNSVCYGNVMDISQLSKPVTKEVWFDTCTIKKSIKKAPNSVNNKKVLFKRGSKAYIYFGGASSNEDKYVLIFSDAVVPYIRKWKDVKNSVNVTGDCQKLCVEVTGRGVITNGRMPCLEVRLTTAGKSAWIAEEVLSDMTNEEREEAQQECKEEDGNAPAPSFFSNELQQPQTQVYSSYPYSAQASIVQVPQHNLLMTYPMCASLVDPTAQNSLNSYCMSYQYILLPSEFIHS